MHELLEPIDDPVSRYVRHGGQIMLTTVLKSTTTLRDLDRLLHPRVPPLVRAPSHIELLSLSHTEESVEEQEIRQSLHIAVVPPPRATDNTCAENQQSIAAPALPSLPSLSPYRNSDTSPNVDERKVPEPAAPSSLEPASTPSHVYDVASPARFPHQGHSNFNDTLHPLQAREGPPLFTSGVVTASEESRLSAVPAVINVAEDDDDEEMPSIDMGSDSD